jgi:hypothetical protein
MFATGVGSRADSCCCLYFGTRFEVALSRLGKLSSRISERCACSRIRGAGGGGGGREGGCTEN